MKGMKDLMQQAQAMQEKMQGLQDELANAEVVGESGAGLVSVTMTGKHEVRRVKIDDSVYGEEKTVLEDLVAAACNDAVRKVEALHKEKMSGMAAGLGIPGGMPPGFGLG